MMLAPLTANAALRKEPMQPEENRACKSVLMNIEKYNLAGTMLVYTI